MATTGLNRGEKIDRVEPYVASGAVTKNLVAIPNGFVAAGDLAGQLQAKIADVAGSTIPLGLFDNSYADGKICSVKSKGLLKGVSNAAINENVRLSYANNGKLKAAAAGEIVVGTSRSKTTAGDEEILVEWCDAYYALP